MQTANNKLLTAVIKAANLYISNDSTGAAEAIADVDVSSLPVEEAKTLYNTMIRCYNDECGK